MDLSQRILSDITIFMKYARYLPELRRRESWEEIVLRNIMMHVKRYPHLEEEIFENYEHVFVKKILPSMRSLQFGGRAIEVTPSRIYNCCYLPIDDYFAFPEVMFLLLGGTGVGYALDVKTPIPTPSGWSSMEALQLGDKVFDECGNICNVTDISNIMKDNVVYKITFDDNSEIICDENHLWNIQTRGLRNSQYRNNKKLIFEREDNFEKTVNTKELNIGDSIKVCKPLKLENKNLDIDPYILGYWLGDGNSRNSIVSTSDEFILQEFKKLGFECKRLSGKNYDYYVYGDLHEKLTKLNLIPRRNGQKGKYEWKPSQKRIPEQYLRSSFEQRLSLLQGLMDSDGTCSGKGQCIVSFVNEELSKNTFELTLSLGLKSTLRFDNYNNIWHISFTSDIPVFRLPRKRNKQKIKTPIECMRRFITKIEKINSTPVKCIAVDSSSKLYLAGRNFIPTHNSVQQHHIEKLPVIRRPLKTRRRFLIPDSIEGWADAVKVLVKAYFFGTSNPEFDYTVIRPKGSPLKTAGGKAPGPKPLRECLDNIRGVFEKKEVNSKLTSLEVHDILCYIADAVLSGGIRRSAMIALFSFDDEEMIKAKYGNWHEKNLQRSRANNSAVILRHKIRKKEFAEFWKKIQDSNSGEPGIFLTNNSDIGTNPCGEISLKAFQFCNLCEINVSDVNTQEELNTRAKSAAFVGTLQAGYTNFHYIRDIWKDVTEKESLLGIGMTGIASGKVLNLNMTEAANIAKEENARVAKLIGINKAARVTTVKPSGTSSLVLGCSSGIHAWYSEQYIRRLTVVKNEPIYGYFLKNFPALVEDSVYKESEAFIKIPIKAPNGSITRDESALDLLNRVKRVYEDWILEGHRKGQNTNNVSATIHVKQNEWDEVGEWMWKNRDCYNGLTVLPRDGGSYLQMPFDECSKEQYENMLGYLKEIDLTEVLEEEDNTELKENVACQGNQCELTI